MKKIIMILCMALACATFARGPHGRPGPYRPAPYHHYHHHHHSSGWFWAGLGAGLLLDVVRPAPQVVVPAVRQPVWIPPTYRTVPVYDAYGRVIRYDRVLVTAGYWQY